MRKEILICDRCEKTNEVKLDKPLIFIGTFEIVYAGNKSNPDLCMNCKMELIEKFRALLSNFGLG